MMSLSSFINRIVHRTEPELAAVSAPPVAEGDAAIGRPERPIQTQVEDKLGRGAFIQRLASALIDPTTRKSTGVVIGITGKWGSGKSSLLNLLRSHVKKLYPDAVVVSFDPWLISGRNDLISQFLAEMISTISRSRQGRERFAKLVSTLADYGGILAPVVDTVAPGLGTGGSASVNLLNRAIGGDASLTGQKRKLDKLLSAAGVPIVVLIDELDRVEDYEIRAVAQLVRSIADFSSISYVLAYDPKRVIQALGEGASPDEREIRGSAYLEKIVQLQVPLPVTFGEELIQLLNAELDKLPSGQGLPNEYRRIERYTDLTAVLLRGLIETPRDISRLVGTFHALSGMVAGEVDAIDLLGYSALLVKSPRTIQKLLQEPEEFSDDIITERGVLRRMVAEKITPEQRLEMALPKDGDQPGTGELLKYLFPIFGSGYSRRSEHQNRLSQRRPLLTVLRLGLVPGSYTQAQVERILIADPPEVESTLRAAYEDDTLGGLLDRIDDLYSSFSDANHSSFWTGAAAFVRKPDCSWPKSYSPMHKVIRDVAGIMHRAVRRDSALRPMAARILYDLRGHDDVLLALWIRHHIFSYGLFGQKAQDDRDTFLDKKQTEILAVEFSRDMRSKHMQERLIPCRWDLQPVYTMLDTKVWDSECQETLMKALENDDALDGFMLMLFGSSYTTDSSTIDKICSLEFVRKRVNERIAAPTFSSAHESVQIALKKSLEPW